MLTMRNRGKIIRRRMRKLRKLIDAQDLDAVAFVGLFPHKDPNLRYFLLSDYDGILFVSHDEVSFLTSLLESYPRELESFAGVERCKHPLQRLRERLTKGSVKSLGIYSRALPASAYVLLKRACKLVAIDVEVLKTRCVKEEEELKLLRNSARIAEMVMDQVIQNLRPGVKEIECFWFIRKKLVEFGVEEAFTPIVAFGKNTSIPHAKPTRKKLLDSEPVLIDLGVKYLGYCSDVTRFVPPRKRDKKVSHAFETVASLLERLERETKVGTLPTEIFEKAKGEVGKAGYELVHSLGHGIGIEVHEYPTFSKGGAGSRIPLRERMVFTLEPAVYTKNFGVRIENVYVATKSGIRRL